MTIAEIPRAALRLPQSGVAALLPSSILDRAAEVLGYGFTPSPVNQEVASDLVQTLVKLEIDVLDFRAVHRYQMEKLFAVEMEELVKEHHFTNYITSTYVRHLNNRWERQPISAFSGAIPEYVLNKAIQIKEEMPSAQLFVEYLKNDPFLFVSVPTSSYACEGYYVEVWDERSFA